MQVSDKVTSAAKANQINPKYDNVVQEALIAARMLISDESSWGQYGFAGTGKNHFNDDIADDVRPTSPKAQCWCSIGALKAFGTDKKVIDQCGDILFIAAELNNYIEFDEHYTATKDLKLKEVLNDVFNVNDQSNHQEVLNVFDTAIAMLEFDNG